MLRQSLKGFAAARGLDLSGLLAEAGLEPTMRAEEVDVAGFAALARASVGAATSMLHTVIYAGAAHAAGPAIWKFLASREFRTD